MRGKVDPRTGLALVNKKKVLGSHITIAEEDQPQSEEVSSPLISEISMVTSPVVENLPILVEPNLPLPGDAPKAETLETTTPRKRRRK